MLYLYMFNPTKISMPGGRARIPVASYDRTRREEESQEDRETKLDRHRLRTNNFKPGQRWVPLLVIKHIWNCCLSEYKSTKIDLCMLSVNEEISIKINKSRSWKSIFISVIFERMKIVFSRHEVQRLIYEMRLSFWTEVKKVRPQWLTKSQGYRFWFLINYTGHRSLCKNAVA